MKKHEPWIAYDPQDAPPWRPAPPSPSPEELFAAGLSPHRYWGWLDEIDRQMVADITHHHPGLTLSETIEHLWEMGGL
jgi:hypothetical protein